VLRRQGWHFIGSTDERQNEEVYLNSSDTYSGGSALCPCLPQPGKGDTAYAVTDSFTVDDSCIPEFPTVFAAITVPGLCFGIYWRMRKRAKPGMGKVKTL